MLGLGALDKKTMEISVVPDSYMKISSALGSASPANILIVPLIYNDVVVAVMELGSLKSLTQGQKTFIEKTSNSIAIAIYANNQRVNTKIDNELLKIEK